MTSETTVKKGDFILLDYTGRVKETGAVFDTTDEKIAKAEEMESTEALYGPVYAVIGQPSLLPGMNRQLEGKEVGKPLKLDIVAQEGFGRKNPKLLQLVPTSKFRSQEITPFPGMPIEIDGARGTIITVTGGRTIVDFNHPLSGKDLQYDVTVRRIITDDAEKVKALLATQLGLRDAEVTLENGKATARTKTVPPKEIAQFIVQEMSRLIPSVKEIEFASFENKSLNTSEPKPSEGGKSGKPV